MIIDGVAVNAPIQSAYVQRSPYALKVVGNEYILCKGEKEICPVKIVPEPHFYADRTSDHLPQKQIALLHGKDCVATTVLQHCHFWRKNRRCAFCGTEISLLNKRTIARKSPAQLAEVISNACSKDGVSHVVLTSGTGTPPGSEIDYLALCTKAIKAVINIPIHVQFIPPGDVSVMDELKAAGVDTVGLHIESLDMDILKKIAPAKADIGYSHYEKAWKKAVRIFGPNQVSSFIIAGLGETPTSIVSGCESLADLGVFPYVVPLRPIPGSLMENEIPPEPGMMKRIYTMVSDILKRKGLSSENCLAGCVRCGACSAIRVFEEPSLPLICHSSRTEAEENASFSIRRDVFVKEQHLFTGSDIDVNDAKAIHLIAKKNDTIVGTVRIYPETIGNGHWVGGRLAVRKDARDYRVGAMLVKEAMKRVKKKGCTVFTAHIQENNIKFFTKLGWKPIEPIKNHMGTPHQLMQADLSRVPEEL